MSKHLPFELAKHHLLIQAFTGANGRFTTEKVLAKAERFDVCVTYGEAMTYGYVIKYPVPDLEELLDLAIEVLGNPQLGAETEAELRLDEVMLTVWKRGDRLTRLAEAIIPVLEERNERY